MPSPAQIAVVAQVRTKVGDAYAWGADGPDEFDCSGLMEWGYAQIGVKIPRTSQDQARGGVAVALTDVQSGDLVFYYPGNTHVAMATGVGTVIHSSDYGIPIREVAITAAGPVSCVRRYLGDTGVMVASDTSSDTGAAVTEHVLAYDHTVVPQEQYWDCGPASAQVVLNGLGIIKTENDLISAIGTTVNGTDYVGLVANALNQIASAGKWVSVYFDNENLPTPDQKTALWANVKASIDGGYGLVANWDVPTNNQPIGVKGSVAPDYGSGEIFHYVAVMGYDDASNLPAVWIADPGFAPFGYWISFDQFATLIPPKGYCYSTAVASPLPPGTVVTPPAGSATPTVPGSSVTPPTTGPLFGVDLSNNNWGSRSPAAIPAILDQIVAEGFSWIAHKVSEDTGYKDPFWSTVYNWGQQRGFPVVGYHFCGTGDPAQQAANYLANDPSGGKAPCEIDFESQGGPFSNLVAIVQAFTAADINVKLDYFPHWVWQGLGSPDFSAVVPGGLVSSAYQEEGKFASTEYYDSGGASGPGWAAYGGQTPIMWQFTDGAVVAGMAVDAMAFKGDLDDLNVVLGITPAGGTIVQTGDGSSQVTTGNGTSGVPGGVPPVYPLPASTDDAVMQIWHALHDGSPSTSRYAASNGALFAIKDLIRYVDGRGYDAEVERDALLGDPASLAIVKTAADAGDKIAALVYAKATSTTK